MALSGARPRIGYIGLGLMGTAMTQRLLERGWQVTVWNLEPERVPPLVAEGAIAAPTPAAVAAASDIVVLCVLHTEAVHSVVFGPEGVAAASGQGKVLVDHSTVDPVRTRTMATELHALNGMRWIDAPVSGGPLASRAGTLTVMAGGDAADIARIGPLMVDVAARFTHVGPAGSGLVAKMINQLIVGCTHAVLAEALVVAQAAGIDAARLPDCLAGGHADGTLLQKLFPRMLARDFAPQGYARQLLKDLEMVNAFAGALKTPVPMTGESLSLYRMLIRRGHAELDTGAIVKLYDRDASP